MLTEDKGFMAFTEPMYVTFGMLLKNNPEKALELWIAAGELFFNGKEDAQVENDPFIWPNWRQWLINGREKHKKALEQRRYEGRKSAETRNGPGGQN